MNEQERTPRRRTRPRSVSLPKELKHINLDAAGIDVAAECHFVAVPEGRDPNGNDVRQFGAFTSDLYTLADWLECCQIKTVVMESAGVYWIPLFEVLEDRGFAVQLVNPRHLKNVPGRKTDVLDCQWLQQLHTFGLLRGSFRPDNQICVLRSFLRQRAMLVTYASHHIQHMQKALDQMNLKLHHVVSDVTGVTGMAILRAIFSGERNPQQLAKLRDRRCKQDEAAIAKALEGNWREEHLFALRQAVDLFDFYHRQILECDVRIEECLQTFEDRTGDKPLVKQPRKRKRHRNEPSFDLQSHLHRVAGVDLTRIDGIDAHTALKVIGETGLDMNRWPTVKHPGQYCCGTGSKVPCLDQAFSSFPSVFEGTPVRQAQLVDQRAEGFAEFFSKSSISGNPDLRLFLECVKNLRGRLCPPTEDAFLDKAERIGEIIEIFPVRWGPLHRKANGEKSATHGNPAAYCPVCGIL